MCELCLRSPCDSRCPNAPEPRAVFICSGCGERICEGDTYYDVLGEQWCEDCMEEMRWTAEYDCDID